MEKKNRRLLALALAAVMSMSLAACGESGDDDEKSAKSSKSLSQPAPEEDDDEPESTTEEETEKETEPETETDEPETTTEAESAVEAKPASEIIAEIPKAELKSAVLKEAGTLDAPGVDNYGCFLYKMVGEDSIQCCDYTGKPLLDGKVVYVDELKDTDYYVYYTEPEGDISYCGIMDAEGNVILGTDEKVGTFDAVNERFVKAYLPEAVTTDKDKAIYYSTDRQFSIDVGDGDVMYSGTVKLYDLQERKFIENTAQKFDPDYGVGNEIITFSDENRNTVAVTVDDKLIDMEDGKTIEGDLITYYSSSVTNIYDKDMNKLLTTACTISEIDGTHDFYSIYDPDTGMRGVMHKSGTIVIEPKYKSLSYLSDGIFKYSYDDFNKQGMVYVDGTELTKDDYKDINPIDMPGFFKARAQDDTYELLDSQGSVCVQGFDYLYDNGCYIQDSEGYAYFVGEKKDTSLKIKSSGTYLGNHLLLVNNDKVIYDLVTGEKVMEGFEKAFQAYGYIYVLKDNKVTIYSAE